MKRILLLAVIVIMTFGTAHAEGTQTYPSVIFAQTDSYMAVKQGEDYPFSFFFIYDTPEALDGRQVIVLYLQGADGVECMDTKLQAADPTRR